MATKKAKPQVIQSKKKNALSDNTMLSGIFSGASVGMGAPLSQQDTAAYNTPYGLITLNRVLLNTLYACHGIIQCLIDGPIDDGFRGGIDIVSDQLEPDDIKELQRKIKQSKDLEVVKQAMKWASLFGGAGIILNCNDDDMRKPLKTLTEKDELRLVAADRWELVQEYLGEGYEMPYQYLNQHLIDKSRVIKIMGKEASSWIKPRLQGWGFSDVERVIRSLNSYFKTEDVIFKLLDIANTDVWKVEGFTSNILAGTAQGKMSERLMIATMLRNYHNAIILDKEDEFEQKQITYSGLPEMQNQNRIGIAGAFRRPMSKLFGLSPSGFDSGEEDTENYNSFIESEVRSKAEEILINTVSLRCMQVFGFKPDHIEITFKPLRVLNAEQEQNVLNAKFTRAKDLYHDGIYNPQEYCDYLKKEGILIDDTEVAKGAEPEPRGMMGGEMEEEPAGKGKPKAK